MKRLLTINGLLWLSSVFCQAQTVQRPYVPLSLPPSTGYSFPADPGRLQNVADRQLKPELRKHAWALFSGLTHSIDGGAEDKPIFETWYNKCDVFLNLANDSACASGSAQGNDPASGMLGGIEISQQILHERAGLPNANPLDVARAVLRGGPFVPAIVLFNQEAMKHIRRYRLWSEGALNSMNSEFNLLEAYTEPDLRVAQSAEREIPAFPPQSVVLKASWKVIYTDPRLWSLNRVWVWQQMKPPFPQGAVFTPDHPIPGENNGGWASDIHVDPAEGPCPSLTGRSIPVTCFFFIHLNKAQAAIVASRTLENPQLSAQAGDYLILQGLHVITREVPQWTWSTFWWHNFPERGPFSEGRPGADTLRGPWRNYLMDTTLSMYTPTESDGKEKICFNPYLEAGQENGVSSNCINCHSRSTYPALPPAAPWRQLPYKDRFLHKSDYATDLKLSFLLSLRDNVVPDPATERVIDQIRELLLQLK